jgi:hypothetical protein
MASFRERVLERTRRTLELAAKCSSFVSDGLSWVPDFNVTECGVAHDYLYHIHHGTTEKLRKEADRQFRECIIAHDRPILAWIYWAGVRTFGWITFYYDIRGKHKKWCHENEEHKHGHSGPELEETSGGEHPDS